LRRIFEARSFVAAAHPGRTDRAAAPAVACIQKRINAGAATAQTISDLSSQQAWNGADRIVA
jgi:hypothetical protein